MFVTQKCQYALRAMFALARRVGRGPVKIAQIAEEQDIPYRFLEVILGQLKQGGFVESRRGTDGGYLLATAPAQVSVGDIVRFVDGHIYLPANGNGNRKSKPPAEDDIFEGVWSSAQSAVFTVFDGITLAGLIDQHARQGRDFTPNFEI